MTKESIKDQYKYMRDFINSYADDLIYIHQARTALILHPNVNIATSTMDAALTRIACIATVGLMELTINFCKNLPELNAVATKLEEAAKKGRDQDIEAVRQELANRGVGHTCADIFFDFWAMRELRHVLVHSDWNADRGPEPRDRRKRLANTFLASPDSPETLSLSTFGANYWKRMSDITSTLQRYLLSAYLGEEVNVTFSFLSSRRFVDILEVISGRDHPYKHEWGIEETDELNQHENVRRSVFLLLQQDMHFMNLENPNDINLLEVAQIRGLLLRNIERFFNNFRESIPSLSESQSAKFVWATVSEAEYESIKTQLSQWMSSPTEHYALHSVQLLAMLRKPNLSQEVLSKFQQQLDIVIDSWNEWYTHHIHPLLDGNPVLHSLLLEANTSTLRQMAVEGNPRLKSSSFYNRLPNAIPAIVLTVYIPLVYRLLGLQEVPNIPPLSLKVHYLSAMFELHRRDKSDFLNWLIWIETVQPLLTTNNHSPP